jgi:hypothetical protein
VGDTHWDPHEQEFVTPPSRADCLTLKAGGRVVVLSRLNRKLKRMEVLRDDKGRLKGSAAPAGTVVQPPHTKVVRSGGGLVASRILSATGLYFGTCCVCQAIAERF